MGFFSKILEKLGLGKKDKPAAPAAAPAAPAAAAPKAAPADKGDKDKVTPIQRTAAESAALAASIKAAKSEPEEPAPTPIAVVDVVKQLEDLAAKQTLKLNWKTSISDLLFLLDIDNSKDARIELAKELGCPAEFIGGDYSKMNAWLHKEVLKQIAENGGNIPAELLD
ncbi:MAG: DUF3597 domain-containing protein [Anaerolineales bacterium]|nr:DUF3597 domain-containing protein [Anaerolineales bacterium]